VVQQEGGFQVETIERWFAKDRYSGVYGRLLRRGTGPDDTLYFTTSIGSAGEIHIPTAIRSTASSFADALFPKPGPQEPAQKGGQQ
jgi:hypothetical protein